MFSLRPPRSLAALTVVVGLLAVAGPAGASSLHTAAHGIVTNNKDPDVLRGARPAKWEIGEYDAGASGTGFMDYTDDALVFSGDAYDNEMGVTGRSADGIIAVLIGL